MAEKQTVYVTLDLRRAVGIPDATDALIVCSYASDLLSKMRKKGVEIWCFEEEYPDADVPRSSFLLLSRALTLNMLRERQQDLRFVVFKPSNKLKRFAEKEGWELVSAEVETCRLLEDKLLFAEAAQKFGVNMPRHQELLWDERQLQEYHQVYGERFVIQGRMGHAGNCTYLFVQGKKVPIRLQNGVRVKISSFVDGPTYTLNGYSDGQGHLTTGPLWQQLMHVPQWNQYEMGTVGVSPVEKILKKHQSALVELLEPMAQLMASLKFQGFFGLDLMLDGDEWMVIECNPRLTASVSLQTSLDNLDPESEPLLRLHAESVPLEKHHFGFEGDTLPVGQIILRNPHPRGWKTPRTLKSGIYALEEGDWKLRSRTLDLESLEEGEMLLLLSREPGTAIDSGSDFASLQFKGSALDKKGQIEDRFFDFYERVVLGYLIRSKDFWTDRFATISEGNVTLLRKPLKRLTEKNLPNHRHGEVIADEVFRLLGKVPGYWFVQKIDGTQGWLTDQIPLDESPQEKDFGLPNKRTHDPHSFWKYWKDTPYLYGGNSEEGIDCSAFVQRYFWEVKGILLPKHSQDQRQHCSETISPDTIGDDCLVFMRSKKKGIPHVGIIRDRYVWHSSLETGVVDQRFDDLLKNYDIEEFKRL